MDLNVEFGKTLDSTLIETGLRDLCPGIHFDLAGCIGQVHPYVTTRQGVYFMGRHIVGMDRGPVPEFKIWNQIEVVGPGEWWQADLDNASIAYETVHPGMQGYEDLKIKAERGNDPALMAIKDPLSGRTKHVRKMQVKIRRKVRGRCMKLGWRHTFEALLRNELPGITRESLAAKFNVDMLLFPVGSPDELAAVLLEE
jgi:hypothetical protein